MVMGWDRVRNGPRRIGRARQVSRSVARSSEPIRGTIERADRQHGRACRVSWLVSRPSLPGELSRVVAELAG
ncbi:hypothetical protein F2Q69_00042322 [Brassica cretica]|uniref:Uncharacterized protein n=1 Tax=Brassica cretica TaxID=69181 RepID=A0A8S9NDV6_BRACR|nr:hypothetical protein F2Q69_00042322 [Brassica cretica]